MNSFGSHVIRALLLLLSPSSNSFGDSTPKSHSTVRSKKSAAWKARHGPMKNVFVEKNKDNASDNPIERNTPNEFRSAAANFVSILRDELGENEVRALAADKVASPVLQV
jgi:nucleolar protein 9